MFDISKLPRNNILHYVHDTFSKSAYSDLNKYLTLFANVKKWVIASDYYFDKEKPNNVITYTLIPHVVAIDEMKEDIKSYANNDIKHTSKVSDKFIEYMKSPVFFYVSILLPKKKYILYDKQKDTQDSLIFNLDGLINKIPLWINNNPKMEQYYLSLNKKIKEAIQDIKRGNKIDVYMQMFIVTLMGAYIASQLGDDNEIIGWLSDRDKINELNGMSMSMFSINYSSLNHCKTQIAVTSAMSGSDNWYDEIVRLPDYITGTLADYDMTQNTISKDKFNTMLEKLFSDNPRLVILHIMDNRQICRITVQPNNCHGTPRFVPPRDT